MLKYFRGTLIFAVLVYAALYFYTGDLNLLFSAMVLSVLEVSVSFDNAVMNAAKLKEMSRFWKQMFLWIGMLVAVGFMRFYLPLEIVAQLGDLSLGGAYDLAIQNPHQFGEILRSSHDIVAGAGGAFLLMVALHYFLDHEKDVHWLKPVEIPLNLLGKFAALGRLEQAAGLLVLGLTWTLYQVNGSLNFFLASVGGVLLYIAVDFLKSCLSVFDEWLKTTRFSLLAGGFGTFVYLEVLDASFSFDGVVAAFAISSNIWVVTAGLAVGALAVRSMTIAMDEKGTLDAYRYLENGAMVAILSLAVCMFIGVSHHLPEWLIAGISVVSIVGSVLSSIRHNRREAAGLALV